MKLFKQLLVAPAALGLLAPVAATAAEFNLDGVNKYASEEQVTSISQFSDVKPTDWAYQALSNLIERYGCVAGYPNGTYKGGRAMTRFEAAALLNACLDRVTEVTDELKKLMAEFEKELAVLKGRVDGLEAKVGTLEAQQFSTTTKLSGYAAMVMGSAENSTAGEQVSFNYDLRLDLNTSFTGKDLLRTRLRAGNFGTNNTFGTGDTLMETAFDSSDAVKVDRLFYKFPVAESFTVTAGAMLRIDDIVPVWPSLYPSDTAIDLFTYAGVPGVYNLFTGAGAGISYAKDGFTASLGYVSASASASSSATNAGVENDAITNIQLAYTTDNWGAAFGYTYADNKAWGPQTGKYTSNYGLSAYWQPSEVGFIPSISAGYGISAGNGTAADTTSWTVGLIWKDAFIKGNDLGFAIGAAGVSGMWTDAAGSDDDTLGYELYYKFQVTDNITVTPALFLIENPGAGAKDTQGGLVKTTFKF